MYVIKRGGEKRKEKVTAGAPFSALAPLPMEDCCDSSARRFLSAGNASLGKKMHIQNNRRT